jgi:inosine-uridine nucleoside N-ribohydrolase
MPVIFDTDMGPDYDDVGAIALLHAFADSGSVQILATMASTKYEGVAAVLNVLNTYFKRPNVPIGVAGGNAVTMRDSQHWSDTLIANYPHNIKTNKDAHEATALYRKILAAQPDNSVTVITVGFLTNLSSLLQSAPDKYSKLTGAQLVQKKVKKLVSMAGIFPSGREFNVEKDAAAAKYVFEQFKKPVVFSGFEIGSKIKTGLPLIGNDAIQKSPVKDAFRISMGLSDEDRNGRMSWDQTAVLVAVKGHAPYYTLKCGTIKVNTDGSNSWSAKGTTQCYLVEARPPSEVQKVINDMMMHQPK